MKSHDALKDYRQRCAKGRDSEEKRGSRFSLKSKEREAARSFSTLIPLKADPHRIGAIARQKSDFPRGKEIRDRSIPPATVVCITRARTSFVRNGSQIV